MIYLTAQTELFKVAGFSVQTWGTLVALGIIIAILLMLKEARKKNIEDKVLNALVFMMVSGIILGRLAYIFMNPGSFPSFLSYFSLWQGGIISWGVLIGVIIGAFLFKFATKTKYGKFFGLLDLMAPYLVLAIAIGRIGCLLRGCCYGLPTSLPWGIVYSGGFSEGAVHPTQLYHSILDFIIFFVLLRLGKKKSTLEKYELKSKYKFFNIQGTIFLLFLILYSLERFIVDFLRYHPASEYIAGFSVTQLIFAAIFIVAFIVLKIIEKKKKSN